jgi:hypothetical protein
MFLLTLVQAQRSMIAKNGKPDCPAGHPASVLWQTTAARKRPEVYFS